MSARNLLPTAVDLGARLAPKLSAATPAGAALTAAAVYAAARRRG